MTKRKTSIFCLVFVLTSILTVQAQIKFEVPQNVVLKTKDDYPKYESAMIDAAKWLEETDLNKETDKRSKVNAFVLQWVSGSPDVSVELNEKLADLYGKNTQLLGIYIASFTRNFIENKSAATNHTAVKAALISIMNVYKKGIDISKSKDMEKLIKLTNDNKLDKYVDDNFK